MSHAILGSGTLVLRCDPAGSDSLAGWATLMESVPAREVRAKPDGRLSLLLTFLSHLIQTASDLRVAMPDFWQEHHKEIPGITASLRGRRGASLVPIGMKCGTLCLPLLSPGASLEAGTK